MSSSNSPPSNPSPKPATAELVKRHYIRPAISKCETFFFSETERKTRGISGCSFEVQTTVWITELLPEYRIAIPSTRVFDGNGKDVPGAAIETRFITYVPTGKVVYDNTYPKPKGIVYEYLLESLLGKKDMVLR